jgi:chorismate synthase
VPTGAELNSEVIESNIVRTCDPAAAEKMIELIENIRREGNSVGGVIECVVRGVPPGSWRTRFRPSGGRSGQGDAQPACHEGF